MIMLRINKINALKVWKKLPKLLGSAFIDDVQIICRPLCHISQTCYSQERKELTDDVRPTEGIITVGQKVKQAGKDVSYFGVLLAGFGITGALVWYVANELLFGFSSNSVYSKALKIIRTNTRAVEEIGDGLKAYGEETSRGRRRHVSFQEYVVDGVNHMRIQFYVSGSRRKGTVHAEARETSKGSFDFRYIFMELQGFPPSDPIIIVDNSSITPPRGPSGSLASLKPGYK